MKSLERKKTERSRAAHASLKGSALEEQNTSQHLELGIIEKGAEKHKNWWKVMLLPQHILQGSPTKVVKH